MKNIYMIQPNSRYGDSYYFPYAAGSLVAYAFQDNRIRNNYVFKGFVYKKTPFDDVLDRLERPDVVGFSCYVWNYEYNKALARIIKERFPDCIILFGGHQISRDSELIGESCVDFILFGEGEEIFKRCLLSIIQEENAAEIPNIVFRKNGEPVVTAAASVEIPQRVSPYLEGYFDDLIPNEELSFSAILETNRGCPNRCAFCDWGNIKARIRLYDMEIIKAEIDWMSRHRIEYVYCADSNFGLFRRDEALADYIIEKKLETGFPQKFQATYSKNNPDTVFRINKKLNDSGMSKGATLSFQSMTQSVLDNIYRENMPLESFHRLMSLYHANGIPAYSEIILGLPGESYETFRDGIEQLLESGQHMSINFYNCELLKNSIMHAPEYIAKHRIETVRTQQHQYHVVPNPKDTAEFSEIVVSTSTMTKEMWIASNILSVYVRTFHNLGLLQALAIYLFYEKKIRYTDFYGGLIEWAKRNPKTVCGRIYRFLFDKYSEILQNSGSLTCTVPLFGRLTWPLEEGSFLKIIPEYDLFYRETDTFLRRFFAQDDVYCDLTAYQKAIVKTPYSESVVLQLHYDLPAYFRNVYCGDYQPLRKKACIVRIDPGEVSRDFEEYAVRTIWFGRRGGQNIIRDISYLS